MFFNDKFYLYYKGEPMGEEMYMGGRETKWGVAIADQPAPGQLHRPRRRPWRGFGA